MAIGLARVHPVAAGLLLSLAAAGCAGAQHNGQGARRRSASGGSAVAGSGLSVLSRPATDADRLPAQARATLRRAARSKVFGRTPPAAAARRLDVPGPAAWALGGPGLDCLLYALLLKAGATGYGFTCLPPAFLLDGRLAVSTGSEGGASGSRTRVLGLLPNGVGEVHIGLAGGRPRAVSVRSNAFALTAPAPRWISFRRGGHVLRVPLPVAPPAKRARGSQR